MARNFDLSESHRLVVFGMLTLLLTATTARAADWTLITSVAGGPTVVQKFGTEKECEQAQAQTTLQAALANKEVSSFCSEGPSLLQRSVGTGRTWVEWLNRNWVELLMIPLFAGFVALLFVSGIQGDRLVQRWSDARVARGRPKLAHAVHALASLLAVGVALAAMVALGSLL